MSGGRFDYRNDYLADSIYNVYPSYGDSGRKDASVARKRNPFEDKIISEIIFDCFCLMHSYDWYNSGDIGEDTYRDDVQKFKDKWLNISKDELLRREIDKELDDAREELYKEFGLSFNPEGA